MLSAYLVDPVAQKITIVEYRGYKDICKYIGAELFDSARFSRNNQDCVYVDDEGLKKRDQSYFMIGEYPAPLAGKGLVLGCDHMGETISPNTTIDDLDIRWVSL